MRIRESNGKEMPMLSRDNRNRVRRLSWFWLGLIALLILPIPTAQGQINRELRSVFEGMLNDLPPDLRFKFEEALRNDDPSIEFTPEQFRRFRDHPANPFDGIDELTPDDEDTTIELRFELPSLRDRRISPLEREYRGMLHGLDSAVARAAASTVRFVDGQQTDLALGIVIDSDGLVITKASEVGDAERLRCVIPKRGTCDAEVLKVDRANDVALVRVPAAGLVPVEWSDRQPRLGAFVLTPNEKGEVISLGTYSAVARSLRRFNQAFLGVGPRTVGGGVMIDVVEPNSAAAKAGLKPGDIITHLGATPMKDVTDLVNTIRKHQPGDTLDIRFVREGSSQMVQAVLAGQNFSGDRAARFNMMARLGAIPNRRADGFPFAFQHDSPLLPEQSGGPITDLDGNVIGMNIARNNRAASYAIPAAHLKTVVQELLQQVNVARTDDGRRSQ